MPTCQEKARIIRNPKIKGQEAKLGVKKSHILWRKPSSGNADRQPFRRVPLRPFTDRALTFQPFSHGCCGRFGRGASLYRHRSQLFGMLWVRLPLPTGQFSNSRPIMYGAVGSLVLSWYWTRQPGFISSDAFVFNCVITLAKVMCIQSAFANQAIHPFGVGKLVPAISRG